MNVIEVMKDTLSKFRGMQELHIDFTEDDAESYGLSFVGDQCLKEDILGNQERRAEMVLYLVTDNVNDENRLENSSFLLDLGYYLEQQRRMPVTAIVDDMTYTGQVKRITVANAMAYTVSEDGQYITYKIQIQCIYCLNMS